MVTINQKLIEVLNNNRNKKIILYGAASRGIRVFYNLLQKGIDKNQILFCDSNKKKWNTEFLDSKIISTEELLSYPKDTCIIISSSMHYEILPYLNDLGLSNVHYFHSLLFAEQMFEKYEYDFLRIMEEIDEQRGFDYEEGYTLYSSMKAVSNLKGSVAEVGVYQGSSAKLISEVKNNKKFYLFDTFEGLPTTSSHDEVQSGWLSNTSLESVKQYLSEYNNLSFHQGIFPKTANSIDDEFCFVHLDTDLYQSTLDALKFFWPRMVKGGRIISHDYNANNIAGIKKAFREFFNDSPEKIIEIADTQSMIIK
jgi:hypothetical protein